MSERDETRNEIGTAIRIHDNAIASIAAIAAMDVEGVKGIEKGLKAGFLAIISGGRVGPIRVERDKNDEIIISVPVIIKYGYNVPEVAGKVQENIRQALEKMINFSIKDINVNVQGIERG